jgi:hypothetical protein
MLAQNFKSAADLGISDEQHDALRKVLVLLETGKLKHHRLNEDEIFFLRENERSFSGDFNMGTYGANHKCGTAACIAGTAELITSAKFIGVNRPEELTELFYAGVLEDGGDSDPLEKITPSQAATALRSYLTTGDARWDLAVSHD